MKRCLRLLLAVISISLALTPAPCPADEIPKTAWRRPLGEPLSNPGVRKNKTDIDDGYWQGAPVGGFGAGTFSRTYRGDFARWHLAPGENRYGAVWADQFDGPPDVDLTVSGSDFIATGLPPGATARATH